MKPIPQPNLSINHHFLREKLRKEIDEKKKLLLAMAEILEQLKIDLALVKREYNIRIGRLYLKLDQLDLEILKYNRIENFIDEGFSKDEALKSAEESLKGREDSIGINIKR